MKNTHTKTIGLLFAMLAAHTSFADGSDHIGDIRPILSFAAIIVILSFILSWVNYRSPNRSLNIFSWLLLIPAIGVSFEIRGLLADSPIFFLTKLFPLISLVLLLASQQKNNIGKRFFIGYTAMSIALLYVVGLVLEFVFKQLELMNFFISS